MNVSKLIGWILAAYGSRNPLEAAVFTANFFFVAEEQEEKESLPRCNGSGSNGSRGLFFPFFFLIV